ncbi:DNA-binding helix-turn-helix protein [Leptospira inadai serovar Lyme str. 10]|uniref:DNA-binding helix-turn-helix protein n=2 Tax=Leptospira inadai serovar Lyme TaxID=293084 RepID=V6HDJ9_9LEPT|nr:helix-turn-helix transcriptional regulator [Leptospira inadai]EQA38226.1 DNA-binding helix-turn-helix protein [Leptospira inadai serovar Lyme str. 10]
MMKSFKSHLKSKVSNQKFLEAFDQEKQLLGLALKIQEYRNKKGLSQADLAKRAHVTQQQVSRLETGINTNVSTFLKICHALDLDLSLNVIKSRKVSV